MGTKFFASTALAIGLFSYDLFQYSATPINPPSCSSSFFPAPKDEEKILCYEKRIFGIYERVDALTQKLPSLNAMLTSVGDTRTLCELNSGLKDLQTELHTTLETLAKRTIVSENLPPSWKMRKWAEYRQKAEDFHAAVLRSKVPKACAMYSRKS